MQFLWYGCENIILGGAQRGHTIVIRKNIVWLKCPLVCWNNTVLKDLLLSSMRWNITLLEIYILHNFVSN